MTGLFASAQFGTLFETNDGRKAAYICYIPFNKMHKLFVQGFEFPFLYFGDGRRRGGGKYARLHGHELDITKRI